MYLSIEDPDNLGKYQAQFRDRIRSSLSQMLRFEIGHQGGSFDVSAFTDGNLWYATRLAGHPSPTRYWNAFGFLASDDPSSIVAEINFPILGLNQRLGGVLASNMEDHEVGVFHRGSIGGGRPGVGKKAFLRWYKLRYPNQMESLIDGIDDPIEVISLGLLAHESLVEGVYSFVRAVDDFKGWVTGDG